MTVYMPGQEIEAHCTRCRDTLGHVIVLVLDGQIAKVQCKACGSLHKYHPPQKKTASSEKSPLKIKSGVERGQAVLQEAKKAPRARALKAPTRTEQAILKNQQELEAKWQNVVTMHPGPAVPYAMTACFRQGDLLAHPVFGSGLVLNVSAPDKMEVLFREGLKALRCQC